MSKIIKFHLPLLFVLILFTEAAAFELDMELDDHGPRAGYIQQRADITLELVARELPALGEFEVYVMDSGWQDLSIEGFALNGSLWQTAESDEALAEYECNALDESFQCKVEEGKELEAGNVLKLKLTKDEKEVSFVYSYPFRNQPIP